MKITLTTCITALLLANVFAQNTPQFGNPDNPEGRGAWELKRQADPETGKIPDRIREKELMFSNTLPADDQFSNRSENINWHQRGPWNVGGITRALAMDVNDENILLAGTNSGGVWRSTNGGQSWTQITPKDDYHGITCIAQDKRPGHTNVWYFGSGDPYCSASGGGAFYSGNGLYKSTDSGLTWTKLTATAPNTPQTFDSNWDIIYKVITYPNDTVNDVVFTATYGNIYKSINGGTTWSVVKGNGSAFWTDVNATPAGVIYATIGSDGGGKGIWRSPDGINFTNITPPNFPATYDRIVSGYAPSNPNVVYFLGNTPGFGTPDTNFVGDVEWNSLWKYTYISGNGDSAGGIWEDLSNSLPTTGGPFDKFYCQGSYDLVIKVKPDDENVVFIGGTNLYRSTNGFADPTTNRFVGGYQEGTTLPIVLGYENHHPDQHEILFYPSDPNKMLSGNDGGVFKTNNCLQDTMQWLSLNNGYITSMFYTLAIDHGTPGNDVVIGGTQDNGSWFTNDTLLTNPWVTPRGGDGSFCAIADGRTAYYFSIQNGKMMKANVDNNGVITSYARIDPIGGKGYQFINPYTLDPGNNNIMYLAAGKYLWKNSDLSGIPMINNWDTISTNWVQWPDSVPLSGAEVTAIGVSKNPANRVYYGTNKKRVYRIDNAHIGTPTPVDITGNTSPNVFPANGYVNCIAVDPQDADKVMVVFSNYSVYSVFYTENGGGRWRKVAGNLEQNISGSGNGPSIRWASIIHPPEGGTAYLLGTSTGLYGTVNLDSTNTVWIQLAANEIGKIVVSMMDYRESDGRLIVSTHSSGMYSTYIKNINQLPNLTALKQLAVQHNVNLYPNPTFDFLNIEFDLDKEERVALSLFDVMGRNISVLKAKNYGAGKHKVNMDMNNLPAGTYYVKISIDKQEINKLVLKN
ncbi:MAG: T9SS type A sorting domain-containing protein [Bacteroidia bacterium]